MDESGLVILPVSIVVYDFHEFISGNGLLLYQE